MKTKENDENYCGVDKNKIKNSSPVLNEENLKLFYEWLTERYSIHIKKDVQKLNPPWTENPILSKYRFCNVRREHDKESLWVIKNISQNKSLSQNNKILNSILFRFINKSQTTQLFQPLDFDNIDYNTIKQKLRKLYQANPSQSPFSNAFYMSGPKKASNQLFPKEKDRIIKIIKLVEHYKSKNIISNIKHSRNQKQVYEKLKKLKGIGKFLAYQIFVDLTYIPEFPFSENEFTIAGPGCERGLKLLFKDFNNLTSEEALFWLRNNQNKIFSKHKYNPSKLFSDLPKEDRYLNIMSLENCMCEFSKYYKALKNIGRPKILYKTIS